MRDRKRQWEGISRREMKEVCNKALRQGGCVSSVYGVSRLIFHGAVCRASPGNPIAGQGFPRESLLLEAPGRFLVESACKLPPN